MFWYADIFLCYNKWGCNALLKFLIPLLIVWSAALAEEAPPTPVELQALRAAAAEGEVKYLTSIIKALNIQEKATADWWASYVAGLGEKK
jgi:hypothetical protein